MSTTRNTAKEVTRRTVRKMEYDNPLPKTHKGTHKVFEEVFINPGGEHTAEAANIHLNAINGQHPVKCGWYCPAGHSGVFQDTDGLWYAYRHHAKYAWCHATKTHN